DDLLVFAHAWFHCPSLTDQPPSTGNTTPVINFDSSLHRNTAASAQSSGRPAPGPSGCFDSRNAAIAGSLRARAAIGVSISPGASTLTRMLSAAYRAAACRLMAMMAPLLAA